VSDYQSAIDGCIAIGLLVESLELDGQWHRVPVDGKKRSNRAGAYSVRELSLRNGDRVVVGVAHNWTTGAQQVFDLERTATPMSEEDKQAARKAIEQARKESQAEREKLAADAAKRAIEIWEKLPQMGGSPYLDKKKVRAFGVRFSRGSIVVPVADLNGVLHGLQFINADGSKKFLTGTAKRGRFALLGPLHDAPRVWIAEGYATAATVHMATKEPVAVAFDAGNIRPVAEAIRGVYPQIAITIAGDDDVQTPGNPGRTKAIEAARAVGGKAVFPIFAVCNSSNSMG